MINLKKGQFIIAVDQSGPQCFFGIVFRADGTPLMASDGICVDTAVVDEEHMVSLIERHGSHDFFFVAYLVRARQGSSWTYECRAPEYHVVLADLMREVSSPE